MNNNLRRFTSYGINLLLHGNTLKNIPITNYTANLSYNRNCIGIPVSKNCITLNYITLFNEDLSTVIDLEFFTITTKLILNDDLSVTIHYNLNAF